MYRRRDFRIRCGCLPGEGMDRADMNAAMPREELYGLLGSWIRKHGVISDAAGKVVTVAGREVTLKIDGKPTRFTLPGNIPIFRKINDRYQEYRSAPVTIGDRATITSEGGRTPVALVINAYLDGASFDRSSI